MATHPPLRFGFQSVAPTWLAPLVAAGLVGALLAVGGVLTPGRPWLLDDALHLGVFPKANRDLSWLSVAALPHWQQHPGDALWRPAAKLLWTLIGGGPAATRATCLATWTLAVGVAALFATAIQGALAPRRRPPTEAILLGGLATWPLLHPATLDVLVPYVGQADLMAGAGVMAAWLLLGNGAVAGGALALLAGLMAKESAAPAVLALPVMIWAGPGPRRHRRQRALLAVGATLAALGVWLGMRAAVLGGGSAAQGFAGAWYLEGERRLTSLEVLGRNAALMLHPLAIPQSDYSFLKQPGSSAGFWPVVGGTVVGLWVGAVAVLARPTPARRANASALRRRRVAVAGLIWAAVFLLPYLHWVPIGALMAGRFVFLALFGLAVAGASLVPACRGWTAGGVALVLVAWVGCFAVLLPQRVGEWQSLMDLNTAEVMRHPEHAFAWANLAAAQQQADDHEAALASIREAVRLWPSYGGWHLNHARIARANRRRTEALAALERAAEFLGNEHPDVVTERALWATIDRARSSAS